MSEHGKHVSKASTHKQAQGDEVEGDPTTEVVAEGHQQDEHQRPDPVTQRI